MGVALLVSLGGLAILARWLPQWRQYRHPLRFLAGISLVGGSVLLWPWVVRFLRAEDPANADFLTFYASALFLLAVAAGLREVRRAQYTPAQEIIQSLFDLFR